MVELVVAGVVEYEHAAFFQQRLVAVHVEVVAERHHLHEQRIQNRVDVVGRNFGDGADEYVALAVDGDDVLLH